MSLMNICDLNEEECALCNSDELVIRRTNKDGSKSEYLISLEQLALFIADTVVTENGDRLETTACHDRIVRASGGF